MSNVQFQEDNYFDNAAQTMRVQKTSGLAGLLMKVTHLNKQKVNILMIGIIIVALTLTIIVIKSGTPKKFVNPTRTHRNTSGTSVTPAQ